MREEKVPQADDGFYRDYLLSVIDESISHHYLEQSSEESFVEPEETQNTLTKRQITLNNLKESFKQDFSTKDNTVIGSNKVPIEVMKRILLEDLEVDPSLIPEQTSQTDQAFLNTLIDISNQEKTVLERLYFIDLNRPDQTKTTRIRENIYTLQGYLRDGEIEVLSEIREKIIKIPNPFFFYKEEWRQRFLQLFFPENHYGFRTSIFATSSDRNKVQDLIVKITNHEKFYNLNLAAEFISRIKGFLDLDKIILEAHKYAQQEEFKLAYEKYKKAKIEIKNILESFRIPIKKKYYNYHTGEATSYYYKYKSTPSLNTAETFRASLDPISHGNDPEDTSFDLDQGKIPRGFPYTPVLLQRLQERYDSRSNLKVENQNELDKLEASNVVIVSTPQEEKSFDSFLAGASYTELETLVFEIHDDLISLIPHIYFMLLPICQGDLAMAMGQFPDAAFWYAQVVKELLLRGSLQTETPARDKHSEAKGNLPWSWWKDIPEDIYHPNFGKDYPYLNEDVEKPFMLLRLGALYLAWADQLYRTDHRANIYRARELYKAVMQQYGLEPLPNVKLTPLPKTVIMRPRDLFNLHQESLTENFIGTNLQIEEPSMENWMFVENPKETSNEERINFPRSLSKQEQQRISDIATPRVQRHKSLAFRFAKSRADAKEGMKDVSSEIKRSWDFLAEMGVSPTWAAQPTANVSQSGNNIPMFKGYLPLLTINPAILSQQTKAKIGFQSINTGLNYFGYPDNLVPFLRYKPLIKSANHFSQLSKQSEQDFIAYKSNAEHSELHVMQFENLVAKSAIRVEIESQRIYEANDYVMMAQAQVADVQKAIQAKKDEIADHNSVCGQVKDYFSGISSFFGKVPGKATSYVSSDFASAFGMGAAKSGAIAGAGVVGGMALFAIGTSVTLSGMADKANQRVKDLHTLKNVSLPLAEASLDARNRQLAIAQLQKTAALFDTMYAQNVLTYLQLREFNAERWHQMASFIKQILRRYMDLGTMTGWLAERALSFEQDRNLRIIRFDYFQNQQHGVLGADALQADVANLEKEYISGYQNKIPVKYTVSLAQDFPLEFGQLKKTGLCFFFTDDNWLEQAYPGTYNHRIRTIEIGAVLPVTETPPRGMLTNYGISSASDYNIDSSHNIIRNPDALPFSEFKLHDGMTLYQLPGEGLLPFEGSGVNTLWRLEMPATVNLHGLAALADITITFHLLVNFNQDRIQKQTQVQTIAQSALFSANYLFPQALTDFKSRNDDTGLVFSVTEDMLPSNTENRQLRNVAIYFIGENLPKEITAKLAAPDAETSTKFTTQDRLAHSNRLGESPAFTPPPAALDAQATGKVEGEWNLKITSTANPNLSRDDIEDVLLGLEYTAKASYG